jgi:hypothetical protein
MQRKAALDLQMEQLQPNKATAAAAAAAELAAAAPAHQTYPYGIPEHLLQQEQQQQQQHSNADNCIEQVQNSDATADCGAFEGPKPDDQCIAEHMGSAAAWHSEGLAESSHMHGSTTVLEQQPLSQQQLSNVQAQHGEEDSRQLQPAAGAKSAPHVTWREEPDQQQQLAHSSAGNFAAASGHGGWHGLVVDCSSPGEDMLGSEQLHDEDAHASLLLQRPNTGNLRTCTEHGLLCWLA